MYYEKTNNKILHNKYSKWYFDIVKNARNLNRIKSKHTYYELHHILPKSVFPDYSSLKTNEWNGVLLTPKEHFICHYLLTKMFDDKFYIIKMQRALHGMSQKTNHSKLTAKQYEICRMAVVGKPGRQWTNSEKERQYLYANVF